MLEISGFFCRTLDLSKPFFSPTDVVSQHTNQLKKQPAKTETKYKRQACYGVIYPCWPVTPKLQALTEHEQM